MFRRIFHQYLGRPTLIFPSHRKTFFNDSKKLSLNFSLNRQVLSTARVFADDAINFTSFDLVMCDLMDTS